jgi:hypothetical protein
MAHPVLHLHDRPPGPAHQQRRRTRVSDPDPASSSARSPMASDRSGAPRFMPSRDRSSGSHVSTASPPIRPSSTRSTAPSASPRDQPGEQLLVSEESFSVASWLLLRPIMASTPDLKCQEMLDRVLLSLERSSGRGFPKSSGNYTGSSWNVGSTSLHILMTIVLLVGIVVGCGLMFAAPIANKL